LLAAVVTLVVAAPAVAQDTTVAPTFGYAEKPKDDAKETGWHVEAKAGLLWLAGNSDSTSLSAGLKVTRDAIWQRYSLTAAYAFAKSGVYASPASTHRHRQPSTSSGRRPPVGQAVERHPTLRPVAHPPQCAGRHVGVRPRQHRLRLRRGEEAVRRRQVG
jgi:hypothetical protein